MFSFEFTPLSEEDIAKVQSGDLLPDGTYEFEVVSCYNKVSRNGNPMLEVELKVFDEKQCSRIVKDYLLTSSLMIFKLKHFCDSIGLSDQYLKGQLDFSKTLNRCGKVIIMTQKGNQKADGTYYLDRNAVKDYIKADAEQLKIVSEVKDEKLFNDEIPF